jgi:hypothetical protein
MDRRRPAFNRRQRNLIGSFFGLPGEGKGERGRPIHRFDSLVQRFLHGPICRSESLLSLQELWPEIVGTTLASRCQPWRILHQTLLVRTADGTTAKALSRQRLPILRRIQLLPNLGAISRLSVHLADDPGGAQSRGTSASGTRNRPTGGANPHKN